jgi:predicted ATP-grasp superfamily ATP-dependent carboligase
MHVFLYEWVTGGGLVDQTGRLPASMLAEGDAMISALAADFLAFNGCRVSVLRDIRLADQPLAGCDAVEVHSSSHWREEFDRLAALADWTMAIAPEFDQILVRTVDRIADAGGRALNAPANFIAVAADKHRTVQRLQNAGVAAPHGRILGADEPKLPHDFEYPAVLKPLDGAGSQHTLLVHGPGDEPPPYPWPRRIERYHHGRPASAAFLCGPSACVALPPCWQRLSADGRFTYLGGGTSRDPELARRAVSLARASLAALPAAAGYVGVDLVLGDDPAGADDVVIEINPRLTTSYVGLRRAVDRNLAQLMVDVATGGAVEEPAPASAVEFSASGTVWTPG